MPTQNSDVYNNLGAGIEYAGPGKTWTIAKVVFVGGQPDGVHSLFNGSKLVNKGDVLGDTGVEFNAQKNGTVINKAGASIVGSIGVVLGNVPGARNMTVVNDGHIVGVGDEAVNAVDVSNFDLINTGKLFGGSAGVLATVLSVGATDGPTIENSGLIQGGTVGVYIGASLPGLTATVINKPGGTIEGTFSVVTGGGKLSLENDGKLKGDVAANGVGENDKVINSGKIKGDIYLEDGNDTFKNAGGHAGKVYGGAGNDTLIAGPHKDQFVFDTGLNAATNVDRVKHFDPGTDQLFLSKFVFAALGGLGTLTSAEFHKGTSAHDLDDRIIYNKHSGALYYDADGNAGGSLKVEFAQLDKGLNLHASDFIVIA